MAGRVVPDHNASNIPISGIQELQAHLGELVDDASIPFNPKLFDDVELQLTEDNIPALLPTLLPPLTEILKATTQDPSALLSLSIKLLSPLSFTRTLTIADPPSLIAALRSPLPGANLLALAILHKAAASPSDAAILSTLPDVVEELVTRWLGASDVGVSERAGAVLGDLLETDCEVVASEGVNGTPPVSGVNDTEVVKRRLPGQGRLWRLLFLNRDTFSIIPAFCSPPPADQPSRTVNDVTLSQGRLLRILPRLATLNLRAIARTPFADLVPLPHAVAQEAGEGLLQWAALGMVDRADVLMHLTLIDFFETFVSVMRVAARSPQTDETVRDVIATAVKNDREMEAALRGLPDRTVEEEAEPLRTYLSEILG